MLLLCEQPVCYLGDDGFEFPAELAVELLDLVCAFSSLLELLTQGRFKDALEEAHPRGNPLGLAQEIRGHNQLRAHTRQLLNMLIFAEDVGKIL